jgi:hypothetical protein
MKPRPEWRTRGLLAFLIDDPWRKLASLALAVAVWLWLSAQTDERWTEDLELSTESAEGQRAQRNEIRLSVPRDQLMVTGFVMPGQDSQPLSKAQVTVSGQKQYVDLVRRRGIGFVVDPHDPERVAGRVNIVANRLTLDYLEPGKLTFELSPATIEARLSRVKTKPIKLDTTVVQPAFPSREDQRSRVQWGSAQFSPAQVTLVGPTSALDDLPQGPLFRVDLAKDDIDKLAPDVTTLKARLQLLSTLADRRVRIEETSAEVLVPLVRHSRVFSLELVPEIDFPEGTPPEERAAWRPRNSPVKVDLRSFSPALTEILSGTTPDRVESWKVKNCRLKVNFAAKEEGGKTPAVFYIYKDGLQEFTRDRDYVVIPPPIYLERK